MTPPEAGETAAPSEANLDSQSVEGLRHALGTDFDLKQRLGRGSAATVYLAREKALGRLVAVKVLLPGRARDETARKRFEREARAAATLTHPNIVPVYRFGSLSDGTPYLVMRYVKGRTMEERLVAEGRLPADLARTVLLGVASALAAAHAQGIVHRDVRPANILWDEDAKEALLTDFGIAALLATRGEEVTKLTQTGQVIADPRYVSPEQLNDRDLTELADMYAFGILGYELYTGEGPYQAKTNAQLVIAHLSGQPKDLSQMRPDVDATVVDLLKRCLNREPKHRPSAARAVALLQGREAAGTRGDGAVDIREIIKRRVPHIVLIAAGAGVGLLQLIDLIFDNDSLVFRLALPFVGSGILASAIVAWFHGERGRQQTSVLEWILLGLVGVIWLSLSAWVIIA